MIYIDVVKEDYFIVSADMDRFRVCCIIGKFWTNIWEGVFRPVSIFKSFEGKGVQFAKHTRMDTEETSNRVL